MKQIIILISLLYGLSLHAQYSESEIKQKCDSILQESELLYNSEKASWVFTDMFLKKPAIKEAFAGYLTYQQGDSVKCLVIDREGKSIYEVVFAENNAPVVERMLSRDLSAQESQLLNIRKKMLTEISNEKLLAVYKDYPPNFILLPFEDGYKLYAICGTTIHKMIPIGNDYLFIADREGNIQSHKQFHSRLFPMESKEGYTEIIHSHLKGEPFISATDICTFRLYGKNAGISKMMVYSPALSMCFTYDIETNTIILKKN